jgi:hypothetical protein
VSRPCFDVITALIWSVNLCLKSTLGCFRLNFGVRCMVLRVCHQCDPDAPDEIKALQGCLEGMSEKLRR